MNLDQNTLNELISKLKNGEMVRPTTETEKKCYKIINDLDLVAGHVQGSATSKKYMRNEIWALISYLGAPSWFITFAPADVNHPVALYYADENKTYYPKFHSQDERFRLIANNPVAGAKFFKMMVNLFLKHVLGVKSKNRGLYGDTSGYYGTVEQQGRLTLQLPFLQWLASLLTPHQLSHRLQATSSNCKTRRVQ